MTWKNGVEYSCITPVIWRVYFEVTINDKAMIKSTIKAVGNIFYSMWGFLSSFIINDKSYVYFLLNERKLKKNEWSQRENTFSSVTKS